MGVTQKKQLKTKRLLDEKLALSRPSQKVLERLYLKYNNEPSLDNLFEYAFALSNSSKVEELIFAIDVLDDLVQEGYKHQLDCIVASATAHYLLQEYNEARIKCKTILKSHPDNFKTKELLAAIEGSDRWTIERIKHAAVESAIEAVAIGIEFWDAIKEEIQES